ncbi:MAG TPA: hypothetical protein VGB49_04400 [Caulobacteraceae bacterium]|jgi:hypothetical protein
MIDELIDTGAAQSGLTPGQVRAALAGALGLLDKHAAKDRLDALYQAVPGAEALARTPEARPKGGGGLFGGLMKGAGGVSGAAMADAMGLLERLKRQGVDKGDLKRLLSPVQNAVRERTGRDVLRDAVESVPGVGALLAGR